MIPNYARHPNFQYALDEAPERSRGSYRRNSGFPYAQSSPTSATSPSSNDSVFSELDLNQDSKDQSASFIAEILDLCARYPGVVDQVYDSFMQEHGYYQPRVGEEPRPRNCGAQRTMQTYDRVTRSSSRSSRYVAPYSQAYSTSTLNANKVGVVEYGNPCRKISHKHLKDLFGGVGIILPEVYFSRFLFPEILERHMPASSSDFKITTESVWADPGENIMAPTEIAFAVGNLPGARLVDLKDQTVTIRGADQVDLESSGRQTILFRLTFPGLDFPSHRINVRSSKKEYSTRGEIAFNIACFIEDYLRKLKWKQTYLPGYQIPDRWNYKEVKIDRLYIFSIYQTSRSDWCANIGML